MFLLVGYLPNDSASSWVRRFTTVWFLTTKDTELEAEQDK